MRLISHSSATPLVSKNPTLDLFAKRFEIGGGRRPKIDQKVAMHGRHLGAAEA